MVWLVGWFEIKRKENERKQTNKKKYGGWGMRRGKVKVEGSKGSLFQSRK